MVSTTASALPATSGVHPFRVLHFSQGAFSENATLPSEEALKSQSEAFTWIGISRSYFQSHLETIQQLLSPCYSQTLLELHISDLLNEHLPSVFDYTSQYDLLNIRRLTPHHAEQPSNVDALVLHTQAVGLLLFDNLLISIHPDDCLERDSFIHKMELAQKLQNVHLAFNSADLMLRFVSHIVDAYLDLRKQISSKIEGWQTLIFAPQSRFKNWGDLLRVRLFLQQLQEVAEDQRNAVQDWLDELERKQVVQKNPQQHELVLVRSRDVLEHIERVLNRVRSLQQTAETTMQMYFSAQADRTNTVMQTLTVLTAIFLPLNLITGFFGMNFDSLPLIHSVTGFWWTFGVLLCIALLSTIYFARKRLLPNSENLKK